MTISNKLRNSIVFNFSATNIYTSSDKAIQAELEYDFLDNPELGLMFEEWDSEEELLETLIEWVRQHQLMVVEDTDEELFLKVTVTQQLLETMEEIESSVEEEPTIESQEPEKVIEKSASSPALSIALLIVFVIGVLVVVTRNIIATSNYWHSLILSAVPPASRKGKKPAKHTWRSINS